MDIKIKQYIDLALKWNKTVPLFGSNMTFDSIYTKIISIDRALPLYHPCNHIVDLGSGNGILGVTLSILTNTPITLIESNTKKASFLHFIKSELSLSYNILNQRIESIQWSKLTPSPDIITAMALAPTTTLLSFLSLVSRETNQTNISGLFWKGERLKEEILEAQKKWVFNWSIEDEKVVKIWGVKKINDSVNFL